MSDRKPLPKEAIEKGITELPHWEWGYNLNGVLVRPNNPKHEVLQKLKVGHITRALGEALNRRSTDLPLKGLRVIDIGCNEGLFSVTARRLGADFVLGVEPRPEKVRQARFITRALGLDHIEFRNMSTWDLPGDVGKFDVALFIGVLYHLDRPFEALQRIARVTKGILLVDTELLPLDYPILAIKEENPAIPYNTVDSGLTFVPTKEAVLRMLYYSGFRNNRLVRPRGKEWSANSYTRHYVHGYRGLFVGKRSLEPISHRLWPRGPLHPPNRVHRKLLGETRKTNFQSWAR